MQCPQISYLPQVQLGPVQFLILQVLGLRERVVFCPISLGSLSLSLKFAESSRREGFAASDIVRRQRAQPRGGQPRHPRRAHTQPGAGVTGQ